MSRIPDAVTQAKGTRYLLYKVHTYGCKVNSYDTGMIQKRLNGEGFAESSAPRVHILNTCAVTADATKEAVRAIRRLKANEPFATVVVTGCAAQVDTGVFEKLPGADLVVANSHKAHLGQILHDHFAGKLTERVFKSNIFRKDDLEAGGGLETSHTRSFLKIQDGCNSFCTYCVIPFGRGKSRSLSIDDLVRRIKELEVMGSREVVLTGVHIGDYEDGEKRLEDLVEAVLKRTKIPRVRLTSLEPVEVSDRLLELYRDPKMCPHFHMSIQSATTSILQKMKRQYTASDVEKSLNDIALKVPDAFVGMDVIVGFPQETDQEFRETCDRLRALPWTRIHVFPYSSRPGTKAAAMEGHLFEHEIKERSKMLRTISSERYRIHARNQLDRVKDVLLLNAREETAGLSRDYWNVKIEGAVPQGAAEVPVRITGFDASPRSRMDGLLIGQVVR